MKAIHRKIISLQARCIEKGLKHFNPKRDRKNLLAMRGDGSDIKTYLCRNHVVFTHAISKMLGKKDSVKAKLMRTYINDPRNEHYNSRHSCTPGSGSGWAYWHHATIFDNKALVTSVIMGIPDVTESWKLEEVKNLLLGGWYKRSKTKWAINTDGSLSYKIDMTAINGELCGGVKSSDVIMIGHPSPAKTIHAGGGMSIDGQWFHISPTLSSHEEGDKKTAL